MIRNRKIELLAPAKNAQIGIEAIKHGADAVYIGAPSFGARSAAGNSIEDIKLVCDYAHLFRARVYVALNTILDDKDLPLAQSLIWRLYNEARIDALIIQDMGILQLDLPPIPLHASTQVDNRTIDKTKFLEKVGFSQIVLARELTIDQINRISAEVKVPLEAFVHGALCVCYSGQCYLSQALSGRSANKGSCAQYCRLPYTLLDACGEEVVSKKHLLSMKDLNLSDSLEELIDAGVSSLKIEGRLKDIDYVKNTVAYYRKKLDAIILKRTELIRSSSGYSQYTFDPDLHKSFNRGFTDYFVHERKSYIWSVDSPKSIGEPLGRISDVARRCFSIETDKQINNGDGLCFFNADKELAGIHVNRVEGDRLYPLNMSGLRKGMMVYRNYDHEFNKILLKDTAVRKISSEISIQEVPFGFSLRMRDEDNNYVILNFNCNKELARKDQRDNIRNNLTKTGNSIFEVTNVDIDFSENWFIPSSLLSDWRRQLIDKLLSLRKMNYRQDIKKIKHTDHAFPVKEITYLGNVMNEKSHLFYTQHQSLVSQPAFEKEKQNGVPLMFTRHCIKYAMGWCLIKQGTRSPFEEPFYLRYKQTTLRLEFDCKNCEMKIF